MPIDPQWVFCRIGKFRTHDWARFGGTPMHPTAFAYQLWNIRLTMIRVVTRIRNVSGKPTRRKSRTR